jgi:hypothetical protein
MLPRWSWHALFAAMLGVALVGGGCGSRGNGASPDGGAAGDGASDDGGEGGLSLGNGDAGQGLVIQPQNPTLNVTAPGTTLQFQALVNGTPSPASWTIDVADIGTIGSGGLFTASGVLGGVTHVTAQVGSLQAQTLLTVHLTLADNPGNVPPSTQTQLQGGGSADPAFKWLYPYDGTVFARGIAPPLLQTGGTGFDAAMLHISFSSVDYTGFYGASTPGRIQLTPQLWKTITLSATGSDTVKVEITKIHGGKVSGPITETWKVAPGSLRGTVYYNSYNSQIAGNTGAVLSVRPGQSAKVVVSGCRVCHTVSADGSTLVAANEPPNMTATDRSRTISRRSSTRPTAPGCSVPCTPTARSSCATAPSRTRA